MSDAGLMNVTDGSGNLGSFRQMCTWASTIIALHHNMPAVPVMKIVIHPPVDPARLAKIRDAAGAAQVVNAASEEQALAEIADADALLGKITPRVLAGARKLRWVQSFTASL